MPGRREAPQDRPRSSRTERVLRGGAPRAPVRRDATETMVYEPAPRRGAAASTRRRLVDLCAEWLGLVVALRGVGTLPDAAGLRARALEMKGKLEQAAREAGFTAADTEAAVFALVAFLDETMLNTQGAARDAWIAKPLQLELYGQSIAGEEFFDRLDRMRRDREARIEAVEVYYTCLALGFGGKYRMSGPERIQALVAEVERDIAAVRRSGRGPLSPHAESQDDIADNMGGGIPMWMALAGFAAAVLITWLLLGLIQGIGAGHAARVIRGLLSH